jgi:hypothetical protein
MKNGWIGVDLDGTLAQYDVWRGEEHIGEPVPAMADRVRQWIADGQEVRIFTARVDGGVGSKAMGLPSAEILQDVERMVRIIQDWTEKYFGVRLPVTNQKDVAMLRLYDDRAVQVVFNTGQLVENLSGVESPDIHQ